MYGRLFLKNIAFVYIKPVYIQKKSRINAGIFIWVDDGARTHDPQNHNLML